MCKKILSAIALLSIPLCVAAGAGTIKLPKPKVRTCVSLEESLTLRQTKREFSARPMNAKHLSDLLWCANGINRSNGKRTTPAARGIYSISLYVLTARGTFKHDLKTNTLKQITEEDIRHASDSRKMGSKAPVVVVMVANGDAFGKKNPAADTYIGVEAGAIMQNIYLFCAASNMNTVVCGSFNRKLLAEKLKLAKNDYVVLTQVVGFPE